MKRLFASSLLCLATFALPAQSAVAAMMMASGAAQAAGLSMQERHAAIKAEAEAGMNQTGPTRCDEATARDGRDMPVWHDAQPAAGKPEQPPEPARHALHDAMLLQELPLAVMQHQRHALPLTGVVSLASPLTRAASVC